MLSKISFRSSIYQKKTSLFLVEEICFLKIILITTNPAIAVKV